MGRRKAAKPARLPASKDRSDNSVALAAFEVRLAQAERGGLGLGAFGQQDPDEDADEGWAVADHDSDVVVLDHSDDENDRARSNDADLAAVDGTDAATAKRPDPWTLAFKSVCRIDLQRLDLENAEKDLRVPEGPRIPVAVIELDFDAKCGSSFIFSYRGSVDGGPPEYGGHFHGPIKYGDVDEGPLMLFLERKDYAEPLELSVRRNGLTVVRGDASYWLGGNADQLDALGKLIGRGILRCRASVVNLNGHPRVRYTIDLVQARLYGSLLEGIESQAPTFYSLASSIRHMVIFFEWIFPGAVSTTSADYRRILSFIDSKRKSRPMLGPDPDLATVVDTSRLFYRIRPSQTRAALDAHLVPDGLTATLRPYQSRAVRWMLEQEAKLPVSRADRDASDALSSLFGSYMATDGTELHFCPFNGAICYAKNGGGIRALEAAAQPPPLNGGILADEMGLGKTVEVITLVLAHRASNAPNVATAIDPFNDGVSAPGAPRNGDCEDLVCICNRPDEDLPGGTIQCHFCGTWQHLVCSLQYSRSQNNPEAIHSNVHVCLSCRTSHNEPHPPVKGTLIVCPSSISAQWLSEIEKHTTPGTLKVIMYEGVRVVKSNLERPLKIVCSLYNKLQRAPEAQRPDIEVQLQAAIRSYEAAIAPLWPQHLATFDVIVTTYSVLRSEVHHVQTSSRQRAEERFKLRRRKRFYSPPSPLTAVSWFRVCLDEAQEVESSAAAAAEMAKTLRAHFRWCVTGTPVGKHGLEDLFGLLLFLRVPILSDRAWWNAAIVQPLLHNKRGAFSRLVAAFRGILWRNTKESVQGELRLPSLTEHIHRLEFTAIEAHFYQSQHTAVANLAANSGASSSRAAADGAANQAKRQQKSTLEKAMPHLLRLRQACCHPQIGSFGLRDGGNSGRAGRRKRARRDGPGGAMAINGAEPTERGRSADAPMTMEEIYKQLVNKAKLECEESQRLLLMNTNATAGLRLLKGEAQKARDTYQRALALMNKHEKDGTCKTDSLQRLHTLEALRHILAQSLVSADYEEEQQQPPPPPLQPANGNGEAADSASSTSSSGAGTSAGPGMGGNKLTGDLHLSRMDKEIKGIRDRFMMRYEMDVKGSLNVFLSKLDAARAASRESGTWWFRALKAIEDADDGDSRASILVDRVRMDRHSGGAMQKRQESLVFQFEGLDGMRVVLTREMQKLKEARVTVERSTAKMGETPTLKEIHESAECSVCRFYFQKTGPMCQHCRIKKDLVVFENLLFFLERSKRNQAALQDNGDGDGDASNYQYRHASELVLMLRIVKSAARSVRNAPEVEDIMRDADAHLGQLDALSSELSAAWDVWQKRDQWLKAFDELEMATMRMRLQLPGETIEADEDQWKIRPEELEARLQSYELECARYRSQLNQCLSQLRYLASIKGLAEGDATSSSGDGHRLGSATTTSTRLDGGVDNECCPICHDPFGSEFTMLPCGHTLCVVCVEKLFRFSQKCPNCRAKFRRGDVRYVTRRQEPAAQTASSSLAPTSASSSSSSSSSSTSNGAAASAKAPQRPASLMKKQGFGTKFDAVVEEILRVEASSPDEKCILFSQWDEVLTILEHALRVNNVSYVRIKGRTKYDERLALFRRDPSVRVMLMNLSFGSRGLNVTEASHVFLVEPIMNPAIEAQAIGRIHRMGQTRPTHVHRFLVRRTVEERIHKLFRRKRLEALSQEDDFDEAHEATGRAPGSAADRSNPDSGLELGEQTRERADQEYKTADILSNEKEQLSEQELQELFC